LFIFSWDFLWGQNSKWRILLQLKHRTHLFFLHIFIIYFILFLGGEFIDFMRIGGQGLKWIIHELRKSAMFCFLGFQCTLFLPGPFPWQSPLPFI
jgi:hypothetical protein